MRGAIVPRPQYTLSETVNKFVLCTAAALRKKDIQGDIVAKLEGAAN
jgi:hypothetical protein